MKKLNSKKINKPKKIEKETKPSEIKKPATKPQVQQNPFVDKYLEFYDDIKIPSRRYDW